MKAGDTIVGILTAVIGLAIVAVLLGQGANTVNVLTAAFSGMSQLLGVVVSPITGGSSTTASGFAGSSFASTNPNLASNMNAANSLMNAVLGTGTG